MLVIFKLQKISVKDVLCATVVRLWCDRCPTVVRPRSEKRRIMVGLDSGLLKLYRVRYICVFRPLGEGVFDRVSFYSGGSLYDRGTGITSAVAATVY